LVVATEKDYSGFIGTLCDTGFRATIPPDPYKRFDLKQIYIRDDFRFDVFCKTICNHFTLSENMQGRAHPELLLTHLNIFACSNEDIFLLKTFTEREGDLDDCIALARRGLDWSIILHELQEQIKNSGKGVWITWVGERFDILEERGLSIPIMDELDKLRDDYFSSL
jgi:hypothetical protein